MTAKPPLQPTWWRTCRVLANRRQLRLLKLLLQQPDQCVSEVARQAGLHRTVASQYLRALNARSLLESSRTGRWVRYRPSADEHPGPIAGLLRALRAAFRRERDPVNRIFRIATAFTHPRRIQIWRALQSGELTVPQLRRATRISQPALSRHLRKLQARGLVSPTRRGYRAVAPRDPVARAFTKPASTA